MDITELQAKQTASSARQKTVLLGVTGSIAAYKACELLRLLQKEGLRVKVVMTESAQELVGAATFRALSGEPVAIDLFENPGNPIHHISLANEADVFVIAPCTANVINKLANGVADDLLTTTALATKAPLVVAPAMNVNMLQNEHTQASLKKLEDAGVALVGPGKGYLACGDEDSGRMSEPAEICAAVLASLEVSQSLKGKRVLITAGPTREYLDPVRYISSPSSGKTGFALAKEAARRGAEVVLVSGPTSLACPPGVKCLPVVTAEEMLAAAKPYFSGADLAIFSAAVADFRPEEVASHKLKKGVDLPSAGSGVGAVFAGIGDEDGAVSCSNNGEESQPLQGSMTSASASRLSSSAYASKDAASYTLKLTANPDVLATLAGIRNSAGAQKPYVVGFAAETEDILGNAQEKLRSKGADLIVANDVSNPEIGFGSSHNQISLVSKDGHEQTEVLSKESLARIILDKITHNL